jgi:transketolase
MRNAFADHMMNLSKDKNNIFLTGDLGFMALEGVQESFGDRFINCGVSEQNMIGVAAGLAKSGYSVFAYSIAPFIYARPFEQIRNDIALPNLPVCLVGNGGGYAYGYMGPTHHALEDLSAMSSLGLEVLVPAFDNDIKEMLNNSKGPSYLRLGYEMLPENCKVPNYSSWRNIYDGPNGVAIALGPMTGIVWDAILDLPKDKRPSLWSVTDLDMNNIPIEFFDGILDKDLFIYEEHIQKGGLGMNLAYEIASKQANLKSFNHRYAFGYPKNKFGSQNFHRKQSSLDKKSIINDLL